MKVWWGDPTRDHGLATLDRLIHHVVARMKSTGALVSAMVEPVVGANVVTADQFIAIVLPARMSKSACVSLGFAPIVLSRALGATATPSSAMAPGTAAAPTSRGTLPLRASRVGQIQEPAGGHRSGRLQHPHAKGRAALAQGQTARQSAGRGTAWMMAITAINAMTAMEPPLASLGMASGNTVTSPS